MPNLKKILLSSILASGLLLATEPTDPKLVADITAAKAQKAAADAKLKALEAKLPQNQDIMTNLKLGYMKTDGNSKTETFTLDGKAKKEFGTQYLSLVLNAQYANADVTVNNNVTTNQLTTNKYFAELGYGYGVTDALSITAVLGYKNDKFSSYDYQTYFGPGAKYKTYKSARQELNLAASLLYSHDKEQVATPDFTEDYASYKANLTYELQILDNLKFNQEASYRASFDDSDNYFVFSNSELSNKISDIFSAGVGYKADYTNLVASDLEKLDTTFTAFLSVDY